MRIDITRMFCFVGMSLVISLIACRPVMTIGWGEIAIILVIALIVVGPMLWRVFRIISRLREGNNNEREQ